MYPSNFEYLMRFCGSHSSSNPRSPTKGKGGNNCIYLPLVLIPPQQRECRCRNNLSYIKQIYLFIFSFFIINFAEMKCRNWTCDEGDPTHRFLGKLKLNHIHKEARIMFSICCWLGVKESALHKGLSVSPTGMRMKLPTRCWVPVF